RLLFDQNISSRLVTQLSDLFPDSVHTSKVGLEREDDFVVWEFAKSKEMTIVTKDSDIYDIGLVKGFPPKIIWIRSGNISSAYIQNLIRRNHLRILNFIKSEDQFCIELK
ncbi:MAG: DUF5615 family PIN-like protein, partial [Bacteroidetes bacterium]|nr:DUF5615 family PIN-like protein [Bacteroidota bacterium]